MSNSTAAVRWTKPISILALLSAVTGYAVQQPAQMANERGMPMSIGLRSNLGHLPIQVGDEKELFTTHGSNLDLRVANNGSEMVSAMQKRKVELGDMSVTTFIKAKHEGNQLQVLALIMNDPTRSNDVLARFAPGLAEARHYSRQHRAEAVLIFAKAFPDQDVKALTEGIKYVSYNPRMSATTDRAFQATQTDVLFQEDLKGRTAMPIKSLFYRDAIVKAQKDFPEYFSDLPQASLSTSL